MSPSELDARRAALCCLAINEDSVESVRRLYERYRDLNFDKVIIPPLNWKDIEGQPIPQKLLFATAADVSGKSVVYVAIGGIPGLSGILYGSHYGDLTFWELGEQDPRNEQSGYFHELFYDLLRSSVPSVDRLLQFSEHLAMESSTPKHGVSSCLTSASRVVFCGHGSGGAISHMAMLTYLLSLSSMSSTDSNDAIFRHILEDKENLISISFGAPQFCSANTAANLTSKFGPLLEEHFFNYFNELDPVPFLLFDRPSVEGEKEIYRKVREKYSTALKEVGRILGSPKAADLDSNSYLRQSLKFLPKKVVKQLEHLHGDLSSIKGSNHYGLFGSYVNGIGTTAASVSDNSMTTNHKAFVERRISTFGSINLEEHAMISYVKVLNRAQEQYEAQSSVSVAIIAMGGQPEVTDAFMVILRGEAGRMNRARIEVTGRNLSLLLEKHCSISNLRKDRWAVISGDDENICWESTSSLTDEERSELERCGNGPATHIRIQTTFGCTEEYTAVYMRNTTAGSFAMEGLMHALGKLVILRHTEGPKSLEKIAKKIKNEVDTVARVAGISEKWMMDNLHWILENQTYSVQEKKSFLDQGIFRKICEELCEKPLVVEFDEPQMKSLRFLNIGLKDAVDYLMGIFQVVLTFVNPIAAGFAMLLALGAKGILLLVQYIVRSKSIQLRTYEEIIRFLYAQIFLQSNQEKSKEEGRKSHQQLGTNCQSRMNIRRCEQAIYEYMEGKACDDFRFSSKLSKATEESMKARIRLLQAVQRTYLKAQKAKLLAVLGFENAGKSTLINLLKRHGTSPIDVADAETGFSSHTSEVQGFFIKENVIAVDFPGVGGRDESRSNMWEKFEKVPDMCVVMVRFTGDVDFTCQNLRSIFAERLSTQYILLVNQVDCIMKGRDGSPIWSQYSPEVVEKLQEKYRLGITGKLDTVYMCCLEDEDLEEFDRGKLKERGILFGEDVARVILSQADSTC